MSSYYSFHIKAKGLEKNKPENLINIDIDFLTILLLASTSVYTVLNKSQSAVTYTTLWEEILYKSISSSSCLICHSLSYHSHPLYPSPGY